MAYKQKSPLPIKEGGSNAVSMANTYGVNYFDGSALLTTAVGTATHVLTSNGAGVAPTFQANGVGTVTSVSGGNNISITGTTSDPIVNVSGATNHAVQVGNSTNSLTSLAVGTTGQVLTGITGADPVFASPAASSISITGNTGGALVGAAFTFTGGTTGLSFGGSGSTETLTFAGITANGGTVSLATDATTSTVNVGTGAGIKTTTLGSLTSTSSTIVRSGTGNIAMNTGLTVDSTGRNYNTKQPCFITTQNANQTNVTGDGTIYTVIFSNEIKDQNNNFDGTSTFTAPITGTYVFSISLVINGISSAMTNNPIYLVTTAASYKFLQANLYSISLGGGYGFSSTVIAPMTSGDTATVIVRFIGGTKVIELTGSTAGSPYRHPLFSGYLLC